MKKLSQLLENRSVNESIASEFLKKLMRYGGAETQAFVKSLTKDGFDLSRVDDSAITKLTSATAAQHLNWDGYRIIFYQPIEDKIFLDLVTTKAYRGTNIQIRINNTGYAKLDRAIKQIDKFAQSQAYAIKLTSRQAEIAKSQKYPTITIDPLVKRSKELAVETSLYSFLKSKIIQIDKSLFGNDIEKTKSAILKMIKLVAIDYNTSLDLENNHWLVPSELNIDTAKILSDSIHGYETFRFSVDAKIEPLRSSIDNKFQARTSSNLDYGIIPLLVAIGIGMYENFRNKTFDVDAYKYNDKKLLKIYELLAKLCPSLLFTPALSEADKLRVADRVQSSAKYAEQTSIRDRMMADPAFKIRASKLTDDFYIFEYDRRTMYIGVHADDYKIMSGYTIPGSNPNSSVVFKMFTFDKAAKNTIIDVTYFAELNKPKTIIRVTVTSRGNDFSTLTYAEFTKWLLDKQNAEPSWGGNTTTVLGLSDTSIGRQTKYMTQLEQSMIKQITDMRTEFGLPTMSDRNYDDLTRNISDMIKRYSQERP